MSQPSVTNRNISHIHDNITEIIVLHQDLLSRMIQVLEYPRRTVKQPGIQEVPKMAGHNPWHSMDSSAIRIEKGTSYFVRRSLDVPSIKIPSELAMISEPGDAAEVAMIFENMVRIPPLQTCHHLLNFRCQMGRFFVYEEYGARYESMVGDMISTTRNIPNWPIYERGVEALANTLAPTSSRDGLTSRKGLTFGDLLIKVRLPHQFICLAHLTSLKPIQRVCKYPLLFQDLIKHTPVIDCPESYAALEKVYYRLRETAKEINRVTNDEQTRDRIQRSWYLQDLLRFPSGVSTQATSSITLPKTHY